jgi:solute carrier family 35
VAASTNSARSLLHSYSKPHPLAASLYYVTASTTLTIFNKLLFSGHAEVYPPFLLLAQSCTSLCIFLALYLVGRFIPPPLPSRPRFASAAATYAPLLAAYVIMLISSLIALQRTSLLMCNTIRRTSIVFVVAVHALVENRPPTRHTVAATVLTIAGAVIAGSRDLAFDTAGYALAITANASSALYLVLLCPVRDKLGFTNLQLMFVNTACIVPLLAALLVALPPPPLRFLPRDIMSQLAMSPTFALIFASSCSMAMILSHATYINTTVNDAVVQTVSAQIKDVVLLLVSFLFIDSSVGRAKGNLYGVIIGFFGSIIYAIGKLQQKPHGKLHGENDDSRKAMVGKRQ